MTAERLLTAQEVAAFLQQNPSFFKEHADVFQSMEIEDADGGGRHAHHVRIERGLVHDHGLEEEVGRGITE